MRLTAQRIALSPFEQSDFELFVEMTMCPLMMKHVYDPLTYEDAKSAFNAKSQPWTFQSDGWLSFAITDILTAEKLGNIGLKIINHDERIGEVGFMIKQDAQGKGFASEALALLIGYGFNELNLNKLVAMCSVNNTGSYLLLEKLGFVRDSRLQQNTSINGRWVDDYRYLLAQST